MALPIKCISSMATKAVLAELAQAYESHTGQHVDIESVGGIDAAKRIQVGENFDIILLSRDAIDKLIATEHLVAGTQKDWVCSPVGIAIKSGAVRPDISTEDALKGIVRSSPTLGLSTGPSGIQLHKLFEHWGIAKELQGRIVTPPPGMPVGMLIARGDVSLGFQQLSELKEMEGIEVLGTMPAPIQIVSTFSAAIGSRATQSEAAQSFIAFLNSPATLAVKLRLSMEPIEAKSISGDLEE